MSDRQLTAGDLVSYWSPQGSMFGPEHGTLGIVVGGPDHLGNVKVSWNYKSPLCKLSEWYASSNLKLKSVHRFGIEPDPADS